jgi:phosphatidylglycerophosphate synthase
MAGALFDFFDGLAARLLKAASPIGKDLIRWQT